MRRALALLFTIGPFVAAAIAAMGARRDFRMLWMAVVATAVARLVRAVARRMPRAWPAIVSVVVGTTAACAVALIAGARAPFGIIAVAFVLAVFATAGAWLEANR